MSFFHTIGYFDLHLGAESAVGFVPDAKHRATTEQGGTTVSERMGVSESPSYLAATAFLGPGTSS